MPESRPVCIDSGDAQRVEIRSVNGYGPRCGCGGKSALHITSCLHNVTPETSRFYCATCVVRGMWKFHDEHPGQPSYWPDDEDRDEPYERPAAPFGQEGRRDA